MDGVASERREPDIASVAIRVIFAALMAAMMLAAMRMETADVLMGWV